MTVREKFAEHLQKCGIMSEDVELILNEFENDHSIKIEKFFHLNEEYRPEHSFKIYFFSKTYLDLTIHKVHDNIKPIVVIPYSYVH